MPNAKDEMINHYSRESPWLLLAKQLVRMDVARKAQQKEQDDESIYRIQILKT
jgi:hypothetical protein